MNDRQPREDRSRESRILLLLGIVAAAILVVVCATVGAGVWFAMRHLEQARVEQDEREAEEAKHRTEEARLRTEEARLRTEEARLKAEEAEKLRAVQPDVGALPPGELEKLLEEERRSQQPGPMFPPPPPSIPPKKKGPGGGFNPPISRPGDDPPAEPSGPPLPRFTEPANPYKPGTQTKLMALRSVELPKIAGATPSKNTFPPPPFHGITKLVYSPKHELLFGLSGKSVWTYDLKAGKELPAQTAKESFSDLSLSPDQSVLFVADYGGERTGYGDPLKPHWVHRFDIAARKWEARKAPKIAHRIEAVDDGRVLLLEHDQWVELTLNKWEEDGVGIRELSRSHSGYYGDIEYDPRTGRIFHGGYGSSSQEVIVLKVEGNKLKSEKNTGSYGTAQGGGPTTFLSQDGSRLFYGKVQLNGADLKKMETMVEPIYAASRDIAFGASAYYRVSTGSKLGEFDFKLVAGSPEYGGFRSLTASPAITVSPDGLSVWVIDRDANIARQFALEGEK